MIKRIYDNVASIDPKFRVLSIGMSDDYNIAVENGSTMIRVGSKIFAKKLLMYTIIDLETTGGKFNEESIIEVAHINLME